MNLKLVRAIFTENTTIGSLYVNEHFQCYTLEDRTRNLNVELKVYGKTAIPFGTYEVVLSYSDKFKQVLPLLLNVPQFNGIRIHPGNVESDTVGCILVGADYDVDKVLFSRIAFGALFRLLQVASMTNEFIKIEIIDGREIESRTEAQRST